jgi:hypothetical protein
MKCSKYFKLVILALILSGLNCQTIFAMDTNDEAAFKARSAQLLSATLGMKDLAAGSVPQVPSVATLINPYGAYSAMCLHNGFHLPESNAVIRRIAEWFDHTHPRGRDLRGEVDFPALELARLYVHFKDSDVLEPATKERIRRFFLESDFKSKYDSENHTLVFWAARYLMAKELPDQTFRAYNKTGAQLLIEDGQNLKQFIRFRARRGWGEFDSAGYQFLDFNTLITLYDYSQDAELVSLAGKMCNLLLADVAVDSLNGLYGGARGRIPEAAALDHSQSPFNDIQYLYFATADPQPQSGQRRLVEFKKLSYWEIMNQSLFSEFRPMDIVKKIATDRPTHYINRERKHLHNMEDTLPKKPLTGSIRKYLWYTPQYMLGGIQLQDAYPADLAAGNYARHQQHDWDFSVAAGTKTRIFTHHPGNGDAHGYWRGDLGCRCGSTFQNKTARLSLYDIKSAQNYQYIHAYLPRKEFDEIVEDAGWIFARKGDVFAALYLTDGYSWTDQGQWNNMEVISKGAKKGSVFEAGLASEFGTFEAFRNEIKANQVLFKPETMTLAYNSKKAGLIKMNSNKLRQVNGVNIDLDYQTYDSPYMQSQWDSGIITLKHGDDEVILDFN